MLTILADCPARKALRDHSRIDEDLDIEPNNEELVVLHWANHILDKPFFPGYNGKMGAASVLSQ